MFTSKSFNLSGFITRSKLQPRNSSVLQPRDQQNDAMQQQIRKLKAQNNELKQQLQKLKEVFIETRINHDNEIRAYDELLDQLRSELAQKETAIQRYLITIKAQQQMVCDEIQEEENEHEEQNDDKLLQCSQQIPQNNSNEVSELMLQSSINFRQKYEASLQQIEVLKTEYQKLKHQMGNPYQKTQTINTNDVSFTGKGESKISFDFGDITAELKDVEEIAQFSHGPSQITVNEQEIYVRDERIENLQRHNVELQHELASKSHKLATIFNAAYEFGGMHLLDYLQNSIGLIERKEQDNE